MNFDVTKIYQLLPALYRIRDSELAIKMLTPEQRNLIESLPFHEDSQIEGPLKSLLSIIANQVAVLEENLEQLYDDQFIETCAEWVVPYIGQLVGTRGLLSIPNAPFSERGEVANTITYRRRKGTASVIEQLAHDVTGWESNVVEYFQRLATTQYMNHIRLENQSILGLKNWELLEYALTPFNKMPHTIDVRRIEQRRGKYNIQNIGVFLWRLKSYTLDAKSPAYKVDDRRYTFDALGKSKPLYNMPQTEDSITHLAEPINVPIPLSRNVVANYLETYYGENKSILIYNNGQPIIPLEASSTISICNLSDVIDNVGNVNWANMPKDKIAIDPVLGRIAFPQSKPAPASVHVKFYRGFSATMGSGGYERANSFSKSDRTIEVNATTGTIQTALDQLFDFLKTTDKSVGAVEIKDNEYYFEDLIIKVPKGKTIEIRASDRCRPVLVLSSTILIEAEEDSKVIINGLLISGGHILSGLANKLQLLRLVHCTLAPGASPVIGGIPAQPNLPRLIINSPNTQVEIEQSIIGPIRMFEGTHALINNSIVDATDTAEMAFSGLDADKFGGTLNIQNSTIIGKVSTLLMELASNCIFMAASLSNSPGVIAQRLQQGCVRFSYFPLDSRIPRPYRCQPSTRSDAAKVQPMFTSLEYGDAGYCQLSTQSDIAVTQGADDESEMGVFHQLYQPQRVANLKTRLDEYLRFGLEAGIFFAS